MLPPDLIRPSHEEEYHARAAVRDWRIMRELWLGALFLSAVAIIGAGLVGGA